MQQLFPTLFSYIFTRFNSQSNLLWTRFFSDLIHIFHAITIIKGRRQWKSYANRFSSSSSKRYKRANDQMETLRNGIIWFYGLSSYCLWLCVSLIPRNLLLLRLYNLGWILAFSTSSLHSLLSSASVFHLPLLPSILKLLSIPSNHLRSSYPLLSFWISV